MIDIKPKSVLEQPIYMLTKATPCPYLKGQVEKRIATDIMYNNKVYNELASNGFRRVENWMYRPVCDNCSACKSYRVDIKKFELTKSLKRVIKNLKDIDYKSRLLALSQKEKVNSIKAETKDMRDELDLDNSSFEAPITLDDSTDIDNKPLISIKQDTPVLQADLMNSTPPNDEKVVLSPVDAPETPDELEEANLKLLTDIENEEEEIENETTKKEITIV